jgi:hypothetical protein
MKTKGQVFNQFQEFKALVENQTGKKIKVLRTDNAGECSYYGSCGRYLPPRVNLTKIEYSEKQEETLMSWLITLEDKSTQEDNLY